MSRSRWKRRKVADSESASTRTARRSADNATADGPENIPNLVKDSKDLVFVRFDLFRKYFFFFVKTSRVHVRHAHV